MEQSPWEANRCLASQEIPRILWNQKVHYHFHKRLQLDLILSHLNPVHIVIPYFSKIHFRIIFPYTHTHTHTHTSSKWPLPLQVFQLKLRCISHSSSACCMSCPSHPPWFHLHNNILWRVPSKELLTELTPSTYPFPLMWETKFHTHTKEDKITVLYVLIFRFLETGRWKILNWMVVSVPQI